MSDNDKQSGGVNINNGKVDVHGDLVGRDKNINIVIRLTLPVLIIIVFSVFLFISRDKLFLVETPTVNPTNTSQPITPSSSPTERASSTPTIKPSPSPTLSTGATQIAPKDNMVQIYIPASNFKMGSSPERTTRIEEKPEHDVYLDALFMDKIEITNAMYALCVATGSCAKPPLPRSETREHYYDDDRYRTYPMVSVSWDEARTYCEWAGRRLPTEAEWEKAARGNTNNFYPWGLAAPNMNIVNFDNQYKDTTQAGIFNFGASPYGILDMAGNVTEWIADFYDSAYYGLSARQNPKGPSSGLARVIRGGSWSDADYGIRVTTRGSANPLQRYYTVGFRCAMSIP